MTLTIFIFPVLILIVLRHIFELHCSILEMKSDEICSFYVGKSQRIKQCGLDFHVKTESCDLWNVTGQQCEYTQALLWGGCKSGLCL